jgi:hypothetical protein
MSLTGGHERGHDDRRFRPSFTPVAQGAAPGRAIGSGLGGSVIGARTLLSGNANPAVERHLITAGWLI